MEDPKTSALAAPTLALPTGWTARFGPKKLDLRLRRSRGASPPRPRTPVEKFLRPWETIRLNSQSLGRSRGELICAHNFLHGGYLELSTVEHLTFLLCLLTRWRFLRFPNRFMSCAARPHLFKYFFSDICIDFTQGCWIFQEHIRPTPVRGKYVPEKSSNAGGTLPSKFKIFIFRH